MSQFEQKFSGRFKIEIICADGSKRVAADWFSNIITDNGLNGFDVNQAINTCVVGSGNSTPVAGDTQLNAQIAASTGMSGVQSGSAAVAPYFGWVRGTWRFNTGVAAGNLSEVGIGWQLNNGFSMFSRALILDGDGNPTTITVLSNEIIDISYEFRSYAPTVDQTGNVTIAGVNYAYVGRAADVNHWGNYVTGFMINNTYGDALAGDGAIGDVTQTPSNTQNGGSNYFGPLAYVNNSKEREWTAVFGIDSANFVNGVKSLLMHRYAVGAFQYQFTPPIPKDNTKTLVLNGKFSWARKTI